MQTVGIAIIAYKRFDCLDKCLNSLWSSLKESSCVESIAVFDDGSPYELASLKQKYSGLQIFQSDINHGVVFNKNRALYYFTEILPVDIVILLEDDVLLSGNWLDQWLKAVRLHRHMNYSPGYFRIPSYEKFWLKPDSAGTPEDPFVYKVVTGQCTALTTDLIRSEAGYLNPSFKGYGHGHVEWACRLIQHGHGGYWKRGVERGFFAIPSGIEIQQANSNKDQKQINQNKVVMDDLMQESELPFVAYPWKNDDEREIFLSIFKGSD